MNRDRFMTSLAVGIILLFVGLAVAPSVNFSVVKASSDNELIEITSEACGIKGYRNTTIKLTKQQYQDLQNYLVDFRAKLNTTTTREEAVPIFKDAVVELNKYGLLPKGMNVEQVMKMIMNNGQGIKISNLLKRLWSKNLEADYENFNCLIFGKTTETYSWWDICWLDFLDSSGGNFKGFLTLFFTMLYTFMPLKKSVYTYLSLGRVLGHFEGGDTYGPADGWIWSNGIQGIKKYKGPFYGQISAIEKYYGGLTWFIYCVGMTGFTGIRIHSGILTSLNFYSYYIGYAHHVALGPDHL
jgi:hypothetical protein